MEQIINGIKELKAYQTLHQALRTGKTPSAAVGLSAIHKAHLAAALHSDTARPLCIITADEPGAQRFAKDLAAFTEKTVQVLPHRELVMMRAIGMSHATEQRLIAKLHAMQEGAPLVVASVEAVMQICIPPEQLQQATLRLEIGQDYELRTLAQKLTYAGYSRTSQVEGAGQFALRGDLLDIFPPQTRAPVRAEFFGDTLDTMHFFDIGTQRRGAETENLLCLPCAEALPALSPNGAEGLAEQLQEILKNPKQKMPAVLQQNLLRDVEQLQADGTVQSADRYLPLIYPQKTTALAYLAQDSIVLIDDTARVREAVKGFQLRQQQDMEVLLERGELLGQGIGYAQSYPQLVDNFVQHNGILLDTFLTNVPEMQLRELVNFQANPVSAYAGNLDIAAADIAMYAAQGKRIIMLCGSALRCKNMQEVLQDAGVSCAISEKLPPKGQVHLAEGAVSAGLEYPEIDFVLMTEGEVLSRRVQPKSRKKSGRDRVKSYTDLTIGDLVVHEHHGIGRFIGMERIKMDGVERDFIKIAFAGTDFLYVPATNLDLISKYIGGGEPEKTRLHKLGGTDWARARTRAKAAAKELAENLLQLYAERAKVSGFAFPADDDWQQEFEAAFPYEETDDQLRCIDEIKQDMQSDRPMERLLCGDVGFGKTEVALRAIMKCVLAGKQAAILVPTTVLARQHYLTCLQRFQGYPISIDLLSRYKTAGEQKKILEKLRSGMLDLIIGTHKLFRKDLQFQNLGLLVIDEEQRFGVSHKEKLKAISKQVDVLTLSATPIPRTLGMALSGIRDMSAIEEPPHDRHPVQTFVLEYAEPMLQDAIRRELSRNGQVYYLHNRVESIDSTAFRLQTAFPDSRIGVAHGKMTQRELSAVMSDLAEGAIDILVCTTIIETGIDIPNANTLIIEDADRMGLAQLHQIRGRVGRSSRHAFAYLTFRNGKVLSEIAQKRLSAVKEFAEFGSGFKIAMRDLEIRGAGNILGPEQSGHMMSVGYDLYLKLLEEAVLEEKGETPPRRVECAADLMLSANIPADYVPDDGQRVDLYRRIAMVRTEETYHDMLDELIDRFGEPPTQAVALLEIALLRAQASEQGIVELKQLEGRLRLTWEKADFARLSALCALPAFKGRLLLNAGQQPYLSLRLQREETPLAMARELVRQYRELAAPVEKVLS